MNTLLHFLLLLCQSCCSLRNILFIGRILGLINDQKCLSRLIEYDDVIRGAPFLVLPRAPQL